MLPGADATSAMSRSNIEDRDEAIIVVVMVVMVVVVDGNGVCLYDCCFNGELCGITADCFLFMLLFLSKWRVAFVPVPTYDTFARFVWFGEASFCSCSNAVTTLLFWCQNVSRMYNFVSEIPLKSSNPIASNVKLKPNTSFLRDKKFREF